jgi:hypothetical protein
MLDHPGACATGGPKITLRSDPPAADQRYLDRRHQRVLCVDDGVSAAGIWNDTSRANTAVQQESNALENVLALARSLPPELGDKIREGVRRYGRQVVTGDWPAMMRKIGVDDPIYDASDQILVDLIHTLALEQVRIATVPTIARCWARSSRRATPGWRALRWPMPGSQRRNGSPC